METKANTVLVLGGGYAGLSAATRIARFERTKVTLVDSRPSFFERIRLHETLSGTKARLWPYQEALAEHNIDFVHGEVLGLDPTTCIATVQQEHDISTFESDYLVYALGSRPDPDAIPGLRNYGHVLSDVHAVQRLAESMSKIDSPHIVVGGGGLTALELASELAETHHPSRVTLVCANGLEPQNVPGGLSPRASDYLRQALTRLGVEKLEGERVTSLQLGFALLESGNTVDFDFYFHATGFVVPDLARRSGISVDERDRIHTDSSLRCESHPRVLAIGDAAIARTAHGNQARMSCATALPMGAFASRTLSHLIQAKDPAPVQIGYAVRNISLGRNDGVIQFLDDEDRPLSKIWTGKKAARWKEFIGQGTLGAVRLERPPTMKQLPPLNLLPRLYRRANETK